MNSSYTSPAMRRMVPLAAVLALLGLVGRSSADSSSSDRVRLYVTPSVVQGGRVAIRGILDRAARCSATVTHGTQGRTALRPRFRTGRRVRWSWQTAMSTSPGPWTVTVTCGRAGRKRAVVRVIERTTNARIAVGQTGFSQRPLGSSGSEIDLGLVLRNVSPDETAFRVQVTVNLVDAANRVLKTESNYIEAIGPDAPYYFGTETYLSEASTVARLEVQAQVGESAARSVAVPPVANLRVFADSYSGTHVAGEYSNPTSRPLSSLARISAVFFDGPGRVVGGGFSYPTAALPPGARAGLDIWASAVPASAVTNALVSIEPEYE